MEKEWLILSIQAGKIDKRDGIKQAELANVELYKESVSYYSLPPSL